jgi:predicted alpha/beta hydrolase
LINNHSPEMEALRKLKYMLKDWDRKKFAAKVKEIESKEKPDWMKHVQR